MALNPLAAVAAPLLLLVALSEARVVLGRAGWRLDPRLGRWAWAVPAALVLFMVIRNLW
jgi:hypothetical protein